mgnify:CR=1 FL=1
MKNSQLETLKENAYMAREGGGGSSGGFTVAEIQNPANSGALSIIKRIIIQTNMAAKITAFWDYSTPQTSGFEKVINQLSGGSQGKTESAVDTLGSPATNGTQILTINTPGEQIIKLNPDNPLILQPGKLASISSATADAGFFINVQLIEKPG